MRVTVPTRYLQGRRLAPHHRRGMGAACPVAWSNVGTETNVTQCQPPKTQNGSTIPVSVEAGQVAGAAGSIAATLLALSPATGPAAPFVAIGALLASFVTGVLKVGVGCGATCVEATAVAQYAECIMHANVNTYMAQPIHYASAQAAAIEVFNQAWAYLSQTCNTIGGQGGTNCLKDRQRGGKYDDFASCYDPIANDPCVQPDPAPIDAVTGAATTAAGAVSSAAAAVTSLFSSGGSALLPLLLIGGLLLLSREL